MRRGDGIYGNLSRARLVAESASALGSIGFGRQAEGIEPIRALLYATCGLRQQRLGGSLVSTGERTDFGSLDPFRFWIRKVPFLPNRASTPGTVRRTGCLSFSEPDRVSFMRSKW